MLQRRRLGRTGLMLSEVGFGGWGIGGKIWKDSDDSASLTALARAFELGVNFVDTALIYGDGHSEQLIGKALRGRTETIYVATKITPKNRVWPPKPGIPMREAYPLKYVKKCTDESLRNLKRDVIDLQQYHIWNAEWTTQDDFPEAVDWLKHSGKARAVGISVNDHEPGVVLSALRTGLIDSVQVIYNLFDQSPQDELFPLCQQLGLGVVARVPFDEGSLSGSFSPETRFPENDWRERYFGGDRKRQVWERLESLRRDLPGDEPLPATAIRFCLSDPAVTSVIPGMRRTQHVEANVTAAAAGPLPRDLLERISRHRWVRNFYQ